MNHPQIAAFARLAKENTPPSRTLQGQKTLISRTMHDFALDPIHDEIIVTSPLTQAILIFRGGANGEEPPLRYIQGPHTQILGVGAMDKVSADPENNEIYLAIAFNKILVFDREASGDTAPKRVLAGPDTQIRFTEQTVGSGDVLPVRVDPVRNLLVVKSQGLNRGDPGALLIFDRTASGNTKPLRVIKGPNAGIGGGGQIQITPAGYIVGGSTGASIGVWNIMDNGDVPPKWRIPVLKLTGVGVNGVAIDSIHKEVFVPSGNGNTVSMFYFPEIF